ncbi:hypothetical protein ONZ51_g12449 [Trametes cubensis]|uniref:Uncharacterized protein n=1 Tax=Trametes cubensis TaxID=1111947 RepID=A0AAD7X6W2_9APHY|nr:hypothetical protein ONZ51_g12449 [Trametes cubensis]
MEHGEARLAITDYELKSEETRATSTTRSPARLPDTRKNRAQPRLTHHAPRTHRAQSMATHPRSPREPRRERPGPVPTRPPEKRTFADLDWTPVNVMRKLYA